jgi:superfamily II DNA/RNA helicase
MNFADLGLSDELLRAVNESGYTEPTAIQASAIPSVLMMRDLIGIAQTGTGKTASFVLPMIDILAEGRSRARMPRSLILEPTRELAAQVAENFEKYGKYHKLSMALLIGGVSMGDQLAALEKGVDVLIATPGRLMDLFNRGKIMLNGCSLLVIDEADRMLDMGFIPDIEEICTKLPPNRQTLLFSATMPPVIKKLADKFLTNPKQIEVSRPASANLQIEQRIVECSARGKKDALIEILSAEDVTTAIIFSNRKTTVRDLASSLTRAGFKAGQIQGDMDQGDRIKELDRFKAGAITVLVASDVAARGLDVKGVSHVINYDVPWHPDDYVHRIGRTGRAGATGKAFTLATPEDAEAIANIEKLTSTKIERVAKPQAMPPKSPVDVPPTGPVSESEQPIARTSRVRKRPGAKSSETAVPEAREPRPARTPREPRTEREPRAERDARPEREPRQQREPRPDREVRPLPRPAPVADDGPDDGWNGPMPDFLSFKLGS